jgi:hypothetical protein
MNFAVHAFMYSYYALKAMNYRVPRFVSMAIMVAQLSQMAGGCAVNLWAYQVSGFFFFLDQEFHFKRHLLLKGHTPLRRPFSLD